MHPSTQTSINCQKGLQGCLWMYVGPNQRQVKGRTWTQITGQTDCACCGWVQPFAVIVKTAQILAITALLGETSKGGTQCPTMLAATCIAKLLHSSMKTRTEPAMQRHQTDPKTCTCTVDQVPPQGAQLSGLQRHTWTGRCSRSCNQVKTAGG